MGEEEGEVGLRGAELPGGDGNRDEVCCIVMGVWYAGEFRLKGARV